jgi:hypothetical protein
MAINDQLTLSARPTADMQLPPSPAPAPAPTQKYSVNEGLVTQAMPIKDAGPEITPEQPPIEGQTPGVMTPALEPQIQQPIKPPITDGTIPTDTGTTAPPAGADGGQPLEPPTVEAPTPYTPPPVAEPTPEFTPQTFDFGAQKETTTTAVPELPPSAAPATYQGRSSDEILQGAQRGLVDMLKSDNQLMQLARAEGRRAAQARGLGTSTFSERAAEGAAISAALPLVTQAVQLSSSEFQSAQSATAQAAIAASNNRSAELRQQQQLAVQAGDSAAARELERELQSERNQLQSFMQNQEINAQNFQQMREIANRLEMQGVDINSREGMQRVEIAHQRAQQDRDIDFRVQQNNLDRILQQTMQDNDIDYRKWLEEATFQHQSILQTSQQASDLYGSFNTNAMNILSNPDTTSAQKEAQLAALREGLSAALTMLAGVNNVDLSQYVPASYQQNQTEQQTPTTGDPKDNVWINTR